MEQRIQEKLLDALLAQGIEWHARRKIRSWCDCSYCQAKRKGTAEISFGTRHLSMGGIIPGYRRNCYCTNGCPQGCLMDLINLPPCDNLDDAIRNSIERVRESLRNKLRQTLRTLKEGK